MSKSIAYNRDCLEAMRQMEDNAFDLAVVDPPYDEMQKAAELDAWYGSALNGD